MVEFEKVRKGLECLISAGKHCEECDYDERGLCGSDLIVENALALIRQQQERIEELEEAQRIMVYQDCVKDMARVMTPEEANEADFVWVEVLGNVRIIPAIIYVRDGFATIFKFIASHEEASLESYGTEWRCWTQRPTDEQRKAVKWDE